MGLNEADRSQFSDKEAYQEKYGNGLKAIALKGSLSTDSLVSLISSGLVLNIPPNETMGTALTVSLSWSNEPAPTNPLLHNYHTPIAMNAAEKFQDALRAGLNPQVPRK